MVILHGPLYSPSVIPASRKRQHPSAGQQPPDDATAHSSSKKRKLAHPWCPPPQFWDGLSKIFLTTNALRELSRRNTQRQGRRAENPQPPIAPRRSRRLRARRISAERGASLQRVDQVLGQYSSPRLKRLKRFATHGGPDLGGLRGFRSLFTPDLEMNSTSLSSLGRRKRGPPSPEKSGVKPNTTTTRSTGPYSRNFQQHLIDHGVYPDRHALRQPRPSLSPSQISEDRFEDFQQADADASKETKVTTDVIPLIEGNVGDRRCVTRQTPFTNLDDLTDGTLVAASPDLCYGARPEQLDRRVREALAGQVVPSTQADLPVAPNYFVERGAKYDMALGERGQTALLAVGEPHPVYDQRAHTLGYTYQNGTARIYAMHMTDPSTAGSQPEYVMTQVDSYSLTGNTRSFCEGIRACRNGRDWAKRQRDKAIVQANERAAAQGIHLCSRRDALPLLSEESAVETEEPAGQATMTNHGSNVPSTYDSDTSVDELSTDFRRGKRLKGREKVRRCVKRYQPPLGS
ncbi:hypothetical protein OCS_01114 [Ophiocordyceps sinensis CO18]|uniref:Uncharacterized protein n=1 Tax=Ophiocordyceps sinensis (strain Co18 / CGMCC 3.14243) TaxID=911162 RepID=T5AN62_OPHSC|nr:hypothetical protein OCS_01114 [Ophiocordyceps sinensis CO18]